MKKNIITEYYRGYEIEIVDNEFPDVILYALNVKQIDIIRPVFPISLSPERQKKLNNYSGDLDKKLLLGSELLFDYGIKRLYPHINSENAGRLQGTYGKPYVRNHPEIYFNISHAGEYSVCSFSRRAVGVDIEHLEPIKEIDLQVAKRYFCKTEYMEILNANTPQAQERLFYGIWTMKESFVKALGIGLNLNLNSFSFQKYKDSNIKIVHQNVNQHKYIIQQKHLNNNYILSICVEST